MRVPKPHVIKKNSKHGAFREACLPVQEAQITAGRQGVAFVFQLGRVILYLYRITHGEEETDTQQQQQQYKQVRLMYDYNIHNIMLCTRVSHVKIQQQKNARRNSDQRGAVRRDRPWNERVAKDALQPWTERAVPYTIAKRIREIK